MVVVLKCLIRGDEKEVEPMMLAIEGQSGARAKTAVRDARKRVSAIRLLDGRNESAHSMAVWLEWVCFLLAGGTSGKSLVNLPLWSCDAKYLFSSVSAYCVPHRSPH